MKNAPTLRAATPPVPLPGAWRDAGGRGARAGTVPAAQTPQPRRVLTAAPTGGKRGGEGAEGSPPPAHGGPQPLAPTAPGQTARALPPPLSPRAPALRGGALPPSPGPAHASSERRQGAGRTPGSVQGRGRCRFTFLGGVHLVWQGGGDAAARLPRRGQSLPSRAGRKGEGRRARSWVRAGACVQVPVRKPEDGVRGRGRGREADRKRARVGRGRGWETGGARPGRGTGRKGRDAPNDQRRHFRGPWGEELCFWAVPQSSAGAWPSGLCPEGCAGPQGCNLSSG